MKETLLGFLCLCPCLILLAGLSIGTSISAGAEGENDLRFHIQTATNAYSASSGASSLPIDGSGISPDATIISTGDWAEYTINSHVAGNIYYSPALGIIPDFSVANWL